MKMKHKWVKKLKTIKWIIKNKFQSVKIEMVFSDFELKVVRAFKEEDTMEGR